MLSRALGLATVMLLTSSLAAERALAQAQNLEAGKSPSQIFAGTCNVCHKSPRGLLKTVAPGSLPGFLRQHYTTSSDMAGVLASYLISNGANDTRYAVTQQKGAKDGTKDGAKEATKDAAKEGSREAAREARSDVHSAVQPDPTERFGHRPRSSAPPPAEGSEPHHASRADIDSPVPPPPAAERGPDGRKLSAKQRLSRRGKPGEELPKTDTAREAPGTGEIPKSESAKSEPGKSEPGKPDGDRSGNEGRSESARTEPVRADPANAEPARTEPARDAGGVTSALRVDPVPPVTPAPPTSSSPSAAAGSSGDSAAMSYAAPAPALTISTPPSPSLPPVPPAGPPAPPISK
jgi:hypothetical protein